MPLSVILKDSDYKLAQFRKDLIDAPESRVAERDGKYFVERLIRPKL